MSRPLDQALVILNPQSGRGHGARARLELAQLLANTRTRYDIVETERPGHAIDLARAARLEGYPMVVAAGGDGTISEVVNGLMLANEQLVEEARTVAQAEAAEQAALKQAEREAKAAERAAKEAAREEKRAAREARRAAREAAKAAQSGLEGEEGADDNGAGLPLVADAAVIDDEEADAAEEQADAESAASERDAAEAEEQDEAPDASSDFTFVVPPELEYAGVLGVVPVGSGNDFATMVGIPLEMEAAVKLLEKQRLRLVDVGSAEILPLREEPFHRYFDNNMGIGLEASVTLESYKIRRLRGALLYAAAAIRALLKNRSPRMRINWQLDNGAEGSHDRRTLLVSVGNSPRTGGGFYLTPDALVDDKALDVAIANDLSRPKIMALLPRAMRGKHTDHPAVTMLRIHTLTIEVPEGAPLQMDGEVVCREAREVKITILPHKLEIVA